MGAHSWSLGSGVALLAPWSPREQYGVPLVTSRPTLCFLLFVRNRPGMRVAEEAGSSSTVRHSLGTELKPLRPDTMPSGGSDRSCAQSWCFNRCSGFLHGSLEDARLRTPCYLACRHATAAYVTSAGRASRRVWSETPRTS